MQFVSHLECELVAEESHKVSKQVGLYGTRTTFHPIRKVYNDTFLSSGRQMAV